MAEHTGWLLDLYPDPQDGLVLWLLETGGQGENRRIRLTQSFPVTFYAAGPAARLRLLWQFLESQPIPVQLNRSERRDLFQEQPVTVLEAQVQRPTDQVWLFQRVQQAFPELTYYDADLPVATRHAARYGTFPLAQVQVKADEDGRICELAALDTPWDLDPPPPPLRVMRLQPDCDPQHAPPRRLIVQVERGEYALALDSQRALLVNLAALLRRHDPDLLLTSWGDTWLLPYLLELPEAERIPLPLQRDPGRGVRRKKERTYFTYGQVVHRGQQILLFGRWHIDQYNAMMFHDYGLDGILESARVTALPVQEAARLSPGTGISAMQIIQALRQEILVPWHKQQAEQPKTALDLIRADQGGLVYQPIPGLYHTVAEIDFISMYPSIMAHFNISPETTSASGSASSSEAVQVPVLNLWIDQQAPGLIPQTLAPLLEKRISLKRKANNLPAWHPQRAIYKARAAAQKWLLVTCFGYLGYKNARFGRIEAHQAVTAYSRECLLRAKEAAEDLGGVVLHMYVDGLWVQRPGWHTSADFQPLLEEIVQRTGLPISLEGIYRWIAFLPSRVNRRVPVANRYFGAFEDGSLKVRGIEARRRDTPPWVAACQVYLLEMLAAARTRQELVARLPEAYAYLLRQARALRLGRAPLIQLVVTQKLSRELDDYRSPSPPARAAAQLAEAGKPRRMGQYVRFVYTRGDPGVRAWDLPEALPGAGLDQSLDQSLDTAYYLELLLRAAHSVLQPLGVDEARLRHWLLEQAAYGAPPGYLPTQPERLPLLAQGDCLCLSNASARGNCVES